MNGEQENWEKALEYSNQAIEIDGTNFHFFKVRSHILLRLKRFDEAEKIYLKGKSLSPENPQLEFMGGNIAFNQRRYDIALDRYMSALKWDHPKPALLHHRVTLIYEQKGDLDKALKSIQKAIALRPTNKAYANKLKNLKMKAV